MFAIYHNYLDFGRNGLYTYCILVIFNSSSIPSPPSPFPGPCPIIICILMQESHNDGSEVDPLCFSVLQVGVQESE